MFYLGSVSYAYQALNSICTHMTLFETCTSGNRYVLSDASGLYLGFELTKSFLSVFVKLSNRLIWYVWNSSLSHDPSAEFWNDCIKLVSATQKEMRKMLWTRMVINNQFRRGNKQLENSCEWPQHAIVPGFDRTILVWACAYLAPRYLAQITRRFWWPIQCHSVCTIRRAESTMLAAGSQQCCCA